VISANKKVWSPFCYFTLHTKTTWTKFAHFSAYFSILPPTN